MSEQYGWCVRAVDPCKIKTVNESFSEDSYLMHFGIKGQKWGVRRFQNEDGTLTEAGIKRYGSEKEQKELSKTIQKLHQSRDKYSRFTIWQDSKNRKKIENAPQVREAVKKASEEYAKSKLKKLKDESDREKEEFMSGKNKEAAKYVAQYKKNHPDYKDRGYDEDDVKNLAYGFYRIDKDKQQTKKQRLDSIKEYNDAEKQYRRICKELASTVLGKHGEDETTGFSVWTPDDKFSKKTADILATKIEKMARYN